MAPFVVSPELRAAFVDVGRRLPDLWHEPALTSARKKALLRCLIDKVVIHRAASDQVAMRIVWRGGQTSALAVPVTVGSLPALSGFREMEARILERARAGQSDVVIAAELTAAGHRSPLRKGVLPSTVQAIRLRHRILQERHQAHPRGSQALDRPADRITASRRAVLELRPHSQRHDRHHPRSVHRPLPVPGRTRDPERIERLKRGDLERLAFGTATAS